MAGRTRRRLKPEEYGLVEKWSACGAAEKSIARELGMSPKTWIAIKKRDPKAVEALERGRAREHDALVGSLFKTAIERKGKEAVTAAIFLLKTRHGYIDQPKVTPPQNKVEFTFQLPKPLTEERYKELLDVTPPKALINAGVEVDTNAV